MSHTLRHAGWSPKTKFAVTKVRISSSETKGVGDFKQFGMRRMAFCEFQLLFSFFRHRQEELPSDYRVDQHGQEEPP